MCYASTACHDVCISSSPETTFFIELSKRIRSRTQHHTCVFSSECLFHMQYRSYNLSRSLDIFKSSGQTTHDNVMSYILNAKFVVRHPRPVMTNAMPAFRKHCCSYKSFIEGHAERNIKLLLLTFICNIDHIICI